MKKRKVTEPRLSRLMVQRSYIYRVIPSSMPEARIQAEFCTMMSDNPSTKDIFFHSIPNERRCTRWEGKVLNMIGRVAGVPDILIPLKSKDHGGLYIEFKSEKGILSVEQKKAKKRLEDQGFKVLVFRDAEKAWRAVKEYIKTIE